MSYARIGERTYGRSLTERFIVVSTERPPASPGLTGLSSYPNPFTASTHLSFTLARPGRVTLRILDVLGRVVAVPLEEELLLSGAHEVLWQARGLASGLYLAHLSTEGRQRVSGRLVLTK